MSEKLQGGLTEEQIQELYEAALKGRDTELVQQYSTTSIGGDDRERQIKDFKAEYGTSGVELDATSGLGDWRRLAGEFGSTEPERRATYEKIFGKGNVKPVGDSGRYLIRMMRDGKPVDVLDDPAGFQLSDLTKAGGYIPETATSIAATLAALPKTPKTAAGTAGAAVGGAIAGQLVGTAKDFLLRKNLDLPVNWGEIAGRRGTAAAIEGTLGTVLPVASQAIFKRVRPGSIAAGSMDTTGEKVASESLEASKRLEAQLGKKAPLTAGEQTGSKFIQQAEVASQRVAQATAPEKPIRTAQAQIIKEAQEDIVGEPVDKSLGSRVSKTLGQLEEKAIKGAQTSATEAVRQAEQQAAKAVGVDLGQSIVDAGVKVRQGLQNALKAKSAEVKKYYKQAEDLRLNAGGKERFIEPLETAKVADKIMKDALVKEQTEKTVTKTGVLDPKGAMGEKVSLDKTLEPISWAVPAYNEAKSFAVEMGSTPQSIEAMLAARSKFGEVIGAANAGGAGTVGGGLSLKNAKAFYSALSDDIDAALAKLDPEVAEAYLKAQREAKGMFSTYTQNKTINSFRRGIDEGGLDEVTDIIGNFSQGRGNPTVLRDMQKVLSPEDYASFKQAVVADMVGDATVDIGGSKFIDFNKLSQSLSGKHKDFSHEIFGGVDNYRRVQQALKDFSTTERLAGEKSILRSPSSVTVDQLRDLASKLDDPNMFDGIRKNILKAIEQKDIQARAFKNEVTQKTQSRSLKPGDINNEQFIDDFMLAEGVDPQLIREALNLLPQEVNEEIGIATVKRILQRSQDIAKKSIDEISAGKSGELSSDQFLKLMYGKDGTRRVVQEVIPPETLEKLDNLLKYQYGIEYARRQAGGVGQFSRENFWTEPVKSMGNVAMARLVWTDPMQSFLKKAAASPNALSKLSGALGKVADKGLPAEIGPLRIILSSRDQQEVADLVSALADATKDLDDVQRDAFVRTYIATPSAKAMSDEEIAEELEKAMGRKKVEKSLVEERLKARMPSRRR